MEVREPFPQGDFEGIRDDECLAGALFGFAAVGAPFVAVVANPVKERTLKSDVVAKALRLEPFVSQDFLTFSEEFLIQTRLLHEVLSSR